MSDSSGKFDFAGMYTCPSPDALVYMVATGGDPGTGQVNPQLNLMVALGKCGDVTPTTHVTINEVTTVAAVWSLASFMNSSNAVGASGNNAAALAAAFDMATLLVNPATGTTPGTNAPDDAALPIAEINTLADILASCVDSSGGAAGDGSHCGILFQATSSGGGRAPSDVISAALLLANNPSQNVSQLYGLLSSSLPFQPVLAAAPASFTLPTEFPTGLSISPESVTFPVVYGPLSTIAGPSLTLKNNGTSTVQISSINIVGTSASQFEASSQCGNALAAGASCTIALMFSPSNVGQKTAMLQIASTAPNALIEVPLNAQAVTPSSSLFTVTPASLTFTKAGVPQTLTVTNPGPGGLSNGGGVSVASTLGNLTTTDNCDNALVIASSSCTISVEVDSLTQIAGTGSVAVGFAAGSTNVVRTVQVSQPASTVNFSAKPLNFGDWALGVKSTPMNVSVNSGDENGSAPPLSGTISGPNASDFAKGEDCSGGVYECKISITFTPSSLGPKTATLTTEYGDVALIGNGMNAGASFTISPYIHANTPVFTGVVQDLTVTNNGSETLSLTANIPNSSYFFGTGCTGALASGSACTVRVTFSPLYIGTWTGSLIVRDANSGMERSTSLIGTGLPVPPTSRPNPADFGDVQVGVSSAAKIVTLLSPGTDRYTFTTTSSGNANKDFAVTVLPLCGGSCQLSVVFTPSAEGVRTSEITVTDTNTNLTSTLRLQGTGAHPVLGFSPTSLAFSAMVGNSSAVQLITVKNNGTVPFGIPKASIVGANPEDFAIQANACPPSGIAPGASCTVSVMFQPLVQGALSSSLQLTTTDPNTPTLTAVLRGTGLVPVGTPALVVSPSSLNFPDTYVGGSSPLQGVTITNKGAYAMNVGVFIYGDFRYDNNYCGVLQPGGSCRFSVQFVPTESGIRSGMLKAVDQLSGSTGSIRLGGTGLALSSGPLVFSAPPDGFVFTQVGIPQTTTLTNRGSEPVTIENIGGAYQTNNCGTVLVALASCQIAFQTNDVGPGPLTGTLSVLASSSSTPYTLSFTVAGTGNDTAFNPPVPLGFGTVAVGSSTQRELTLAGFRNTPSLGVGFSGTNASDFSVVNTSGGIGWSYSSTTIAFTPHGPGLRTATALTIWGNVELYGVGNSDGADFTITPNDFPDKIVPGYIGTATVANTGSAPLILQVENQDFNYKVFGGDCFGPTLKPGTTCKFNVTMNANPGKGPLPETLKIADAISGTLRTLQLDGDTGPAISAPILSPSSIDMGNVQVNESSDVHYISVTAPSRHPVTASISRPEDYLLDASACAQGTPCQIAVRFHPSSAGNKNAGIGVTDPVTGSYAAASVNGIAGLPQFAVSPSSLTFPTQVIGSTWVTEDVTVANSGNAPLLVSQAILTGTNSSDFIIGANTCYQNYPYQIPPGGSCKISINFVPRALGDRSAVLQLTGNASTVATVPFSGSSTAQ